MSRRITESFAKAKREGRGAFVAYLTIGYPTLEASERAADEIIAGGADILELGVPFSDPFADGGAQEHFSRFRSAPHTGHSPRQSSRQRRFIGNASVISVRTSSEISQISACGGISTKS